MSYEYLRQYLTYVTNYEEQKAKVLEVIELFRHNSSGLLAEMRRISESSTVEDLRARLGYAIHYMWLLDQYQQFNVHMDLIRLYLENPMDERIDEDAKVHISASFRTVPTILKSYRGFDIHTPIYDEKFRVFDPTSYHIDLLHGGNTIRYSIVYAQVMLALLLNNNSAELDTFVREFAYKVVELADSEVITTHYMLFLERHLDLEGQVGGGRSYNRSHLQFIGKYLLEYLVSESTWPEDVAVRKYKYYHAGSWNVCEKLLRAIVIDHKVYIDGLLEYIESPSCLDREGMTDIAEFLKMLKMKQRQRNTRRRRPQSRR